jgi:hypothetical protein
LQRPRQIEPEAKPTPKNEEPTTMALAFRKAAERARQKGNGR